MGNDEMLMTTRAVRRRLDPIGRSIESWCSSLRIAFQDQRIEPGTLAMAVDRRSGGDEAFHDLTLSRSTTTLPARTIVRTTQVPRPSV